MAVTIADLPASVVLAVVQNGDGSWPNRPTNRTDLTFIWVRIVASSADPAAVTSPAVNGAYAHDLKGGVL